MIACQSSGSTDSEISIEPFKSANSTVTSLRSPSSAERDERIFSARCFGVYVRGAGGGFARGASTDRPHSRQNLALLGSSAPQAVQQRPSEAPHSRQNLARS